MGEGRGEGEFAPESEVVFARALSSASLAVSMQSEAPFTLNLSPLRAGRGDLERTCVGPLFGDPTRCHRGFPSPFVKGRGLGFVSTAWLDRNISCRFPSDGWSRLPACFGRQLAGICLAVAVVALRQPRRVQPGSPAQRAGCPCHPKAVKYSGQDDLRRGANRSGKFSLRFRAAHDSFLLRKSMGTGANRGTGERIHYPRLFHLYTG